MEIPDFVKLWCSRERGLKFDPLFVMEKEMLFDAAWMEFHLIDGEMSLPEARYAIMGKYPQTNNICQPNSVLRLVMPFPDTVHEIPTEAEKEQWMKRLL